MFQLSFQLVNRYLIYAYNCLIKCYPRLAGLMLVCCQMYQFALGGINSVKNSQILYNRNDKKSQKDKMAKWPLCLPRGVIQVFMSCVLSI